MKGPIPAVTGFERIFADLVAMPPHRRVTVTEIHLCQRYRISEYEAQYVMRVLPNKLALERAGV